MTKYKKAVEQAARALVELCQNGDLAEPPSSLFVSWKEYCTESGTTWVPLRTLDCGCDAGDLIREVATLIEGLAKPSRPATIRRMYVLIATTLGWAMPDLTCPRIRRHSRGAAKKTSVAKTKKKPEAKSHVIGNPPPNLVELIWEET